MNNTDLAQTVNDMLQCSGNAELLFRPLIFPSNDNQNMAVVQCTLNRNRLSISNFGIATAQEIESNNPKDILDAARNDSLNNILSMTKFYPQAVDVGHTHISHSKKQLSLANSDKSKFQGGGVNPMSEKQAKYIEGLCRKQRENFDNIAKRVCGKSISELTGADANAIISELK